MKYKYIILSVVLVGIVVGGFLYWFNLPDAHFQNIDGKIMLDKTVFEEGKSKSDVTIIPDDAKVVKVITSREGLPKIEGEVIKVKLDLFDGEKWVENFMGFGTSGGEFLKKDGTIATSSMVKRILPAGTNRKIKLQIDSHANLQTAVSVEFE